MMYSLATLATLALASIAQAQTTHNVAVGPGNTLTFNPTNITAAVGDIIDFQFTGSFHSATQSSFADPCKPLSSSSFDSGFVSTFSITINDTNPVWVYCKQVGHCQAGMVFAVNADATGANNFAAFQNTAKGITTGGGGSSVSSTGAPSSSASSSAAPTSSSSSVSGGGGGGYGGGSNAGFATFGDARSLVGGVVTGAGALAAGFLFL